MKASPLDLQGKGATTITTAIIHDNHHHLHHHSQQPKQQPLDPFSFLWGNSNTTTGSSSSSSNNKSKEGTEPRSVLDHIPSPSPPSSTSTLSSSLPEAPSALAALSDANPSSWPPPPPSTTSSDKREEWVPELQPISSLDAPLLSSSVHHHHHHHQHKCLDDDEDWASMLDPTPSPHDHSFLKWIMSDIDDQKATPPPPPPQQPPVLGDLAAAAAEEGGGFGLPADSSGFGLEQIANSNGKAPLLGSIFPGSGVDSFLPPGNAAGLFDPSEEKPRLFPSTNPLHHPPPQNPSFLLPLSPYSLLDHHSPQQQLALPSPSKKLHSIPNPTTPTTTTTTTQIPQNHRRHHQLMQPGQHHHHQQQTSSFSFPFPVPPLSQRVATPHNKLDATTHHFASQQQPEVVDQLLKAAELIGGGSFISAQGILARLNHQLPSPLGKPHIRSAFYFKEALLNATSSTTRTSAVPAAAAASSNPNNPLKTPLDVVLKISAYKSFSEISPLLQFTNFTCIQTLLEELSTSDHIHLLDFDIGFGGQWSSFLQELSHRRSLTSLRITAFLSPSSTSYHPLELALTSENLTHFAANLGIPFEFNVLPLDSFDPAAFEQSISPNEAIAVSIPISSASSTTTPSFLRHIKQLSPKVIVAVDHGCNRGDLPFSQHMRNLLHSHTMLLESIDASGASLDATDKIERLLLQPRIEAAIAHGCLATDRMAASPWRTMATSAGFVPVHFSNFTETQAECLLKKVPVRGFHAEKRHSSLVLFWQRQELVSISAWRC